MTAFHMGLMYIVYIYVCVTYVACIVKVSCHSSVELHVGVHCLYIPMVM